MPDKIFPSYHFPIFKMGEETSAIFHPNHSRRNSSKRRKELSEEGRMVNHPAGRIHFTSQAALGKFAGKFRCLLQHMAWARQGGEHNTDQIS